jgi:signal transduction histidine kinase
LQSLKISDVVREAVQIERESADRRGVQIETRDDSDGAMILADLPLVEQAVRNILANAIAATPHGGRLRVDIELAAGEVVLNVRDQGPGIPPNIRDRVFDLYFTTKQDSSGVGLAVAAQVVQLHGGTIDCVSEAGEGTTFRLRFPSAEMREATEAQ